MDVVGATRETSFLPDVFVSTALKGPVYHGYRPPKYLVPLRLFSSRVQNEPNKARSTNVPGTYRDIAGIGNARTTAQSFRKLGAIYFRLFDSDRAQVLQQGRNEDDLLAGVLFTGLGFEGALPVVVAESDAKLNFSSLMFLPSWKVSREHTHRCDPSRRVRNVRFSGLLVCGSLHISAM